ncbi:MAG TPA: hypothetical protein VF824_04545 [Thermoanaerobaculia bacterium]|jgi:hypothetical protein
MQHKRSLLLLALLAVCAPLAAQNHWSWSHRVELRGDYRWSDDDRFALRFPFPPEFIPRGQTQVFEETPDPGHHLELNVADLQLDLGYGELFAARIKAHAQALHRRNPTSSDKQTDIDELFLRIGPKPEFLDRPSGTTLFLQAGKFPKMERQPVRLLESYGLAATSFNRFEDVQILAGGTVGRSVYWRVAAANGNPLFFRDPNALAGDNGTPELREPFPTPKFHSGFPILYNAETEDLFFNTDHVQIGEGLGYRWENASQTFGFDAIAFHYRRSMAAREQLTGTFYGGDLDLLDNVVPQLPQSGLPISSRTKEEYGARLYSEWRAATLITQFTKQNVAGLQREGWETELGYSIPLHLGFVESIQPAVRASGLTNRFRTLATLFPAPSVWWNWTKYDAGLRITLRHGLDVTAETTRHSIGSPSKQKLRLRETLVTVRWRV